MRFQKGNKLAKGGPRPNSGRKPVEVRAVLEEIQKLVHETGEPLALAAFKAQAKEAMKAKPNMNRVIALDKIINRQVGKPRETLDLNVGGGVNLLAKIEAAQSKSTTQLLSDMAG